MPEYNPGNEEAIRLAEAAATSRPARLKGYYICSAFTGCGTEFLKAVPSRQARCPFCGKLCDRVLIMDPVSVQAAVLRWVEDGVYSDLKADVKERKEVC